MEIYLIGFQLKIINMDNDNNGPSYCVEMEPKFFTPLSLTERKGEGVKLQV